MGKCINKIGTAALVQNTCAHVCHIWPALASLLPWRPACAEVCHGGSACCAQCVHAVGAAGGKCWQGQVHGWVSAVNVMSVQTKS